MSDHGQQPKSTLKLRKLIEAVPLGSSNVHFGGSRYLVTKSSFNKGRSFKIYAEELGGKDFISANFYLTSQDFMMKPCEMPEEKVIEFLSSLKIIPADAV